MKRHPPYHLKTNKAVERFLLVDLLRRLVEEFPSLADYTYYSLGGPFLEDFKLIGEYLPGLSSVCLEGDPDTYKRQKKHLFSSATELIDKKIEDYIDQDFNPGEKDIVWLDFTDLKFGNLEKFQSVVSKLAGGSVVRVTLNADRPYVPSLVTPYLSDMQIAEIQNAQRDRFIERFDRALPSERRDILNSEEKFAQTVVNMVKWASENALDPINTDYRFLPVQLYRYRDGAQMVSVTGVVVESAEMEEDYREKLCRNSWFSDSWLDLEEIDVPDLSLIERLWLSPCLPKYSKTPSRLARRLGYSIDNNPDLNKRKLQQYGKYYEYFPLFGKLRV